MLHLCSHCYHGDRLAGYGIDDQRHSYHDYRHDYQDVHNFPAGFFLENKKMLQLSIIFHNEFLYNNSVRFRLLRVSYFPIFISINQHSKTYCNGFLEYLNHTGYCVFS